VRTSRKRKYDTGATDTEIKIGNIIPYSGPASAYGIIGKTRPPISTRSMQKAASTAARSISFPMTIKQSAQGGRAGPQAGRKRRGAPDLQPARHAVELGDPEVHERQEGAAAVRRDRRNQWNDPKNFPWTMGWQPNYQSEGVIYAKFLMKEKPNGKIGILYQNDDFGKDVLKGLKDVWRQGCFHDHRGRATRHRSPPSTAGRCAQVERRMSSSASPRRSSARSPSRRSQTGWKPLFILNNVASSTGSVIKPAGFENAQGVISATYGKDPTDPQWKDDPGVKNFDAFLVKYFPKPTAPIHRSLTATAPRRPWCMC
jgi:branched-chain amino acid transport system substrate-binding protein